MLGVLAITALVGYSLTGAKPILAAGASGRLQDLRFPRRRGGLGDAGGVGHLPPVNADADGTNADPGRDEGAAAGQPEVADTLAVEEAGAVVRDGGDGAAGAQAREAAVDDANDNAELGGVPASTQTSWTARRALVVKAIQHAWQGYKQSAWGLDELHPLTNRGSNWFGLGLTIVDSLDTLWLAGLETEFNEARTWVANSLQVDTDSTVNLFEVTIRVLGGLLSAHYLTKDAVFLSKAADLGDRLMGAFNSPTAIPFASVNLHTREGIRAHFSGGASSTSEVTTLQLEFAYLSSLTGDDRYRRAADAVIAHVDGLDKMDGLVPVFIR